ncbi:sodium/glucose cotransporter 4-like [Liolophura sinensis]|uniref:sodium/glucose cotransporter 4-like n=1 Tax=Liolophura sinensis TaxID=3198878 RepID=UPI0031582A2C
MSDHAELEWTDYLTLAIYLVIVLIVGLWATLRPDRGTTTDYFLASRHMTWFPIGASLYASNIGAHMFVGIPASGAESGMAILIYEWHVEVQRCLAAKTITHAKAGAVFAGFLKLVGAFLFVIPGMIARALFPENVACAEPSKCEEFCDNPTGCWNMAYPLLMSQVLPAGLQGLMLAAILSALMSTLTSVFNSTSALFSVDVWLVFRPNAHEREVMVVSRACIFVLMLLSISLLPVHQQSPGGQLWDIVQSVSAYCCTPVSVIMIMSILSKQTTEAVWQ